MKNLAFSAICFLSVLSAHSTNLDFEIGDTLYVWANEGLLMRKAPTFDSPMITKLKYGEQIIVNEKDDRDYEFVVANSATGNKTVFPKIVLMGRFVKILYKGSYGFIYTGFLSKLQPMKEREGLDEYFKRTLGQLQVIDRSKENSENKFKRIVYKNGVISQHVRGSENWWSNLYLIPDISLREAYLLINRLTGFEENYKRSLNEGSTWIETHPTKFEPNEIVLQSSAFEEIVIQMKNSYVVITMDGGN